MTVIAWDGKTLAADKLMQSGNTIQSTTKIFRKNGCLVGICGNLSVGMEVLDWWEAGGKLESYPASNRNLNEGASLVVVREDKTVWKYENSPVPFKVEGEFCAFGCGDESALSAMECGADARRAVEVASKFNSGCGNGMDAIDL